MGGVWHIKHPPPPFCSPFLRIGIPRPSLSECHIMSDNSLCYPNKILQLKMTFFGFLPLPYNWGYYDSKTRITLPVVVPYDDPPI